MELVKVAVGLALALILAWAALLLTLLAARPNENTVPESLRLLPDLVRLATRLAKDRSQPRGVRIRLALLLAYLACPIDLVPGLGARAGVRRRCHHRLVDTRAV